MQFAPGGERLCVSRDDIVSYLDMLFGYADFGGDHKGCIVLRGVGEKGSQQEGVFRENEGVRGDLGREFIIEKVVGAATRWANHRNASFIIPAVMDLRCLDKGVKAGDEAVRWFTTVVVDIDKGNTDEKLAHAVRHLGPPSMVVRSGGTTDSGHPKRHLYWRLQEPTDKIETVAASRKTLALKLGGDTSFGRMPQVIRIPGSVYGKGGVAKLCTIENHNAAEYDCEDLLLAIEDMSFAPGVEEQVAAVIKDIVNYRIETGGLNFSGYHAAGGDGASKSDVGRALTTIVHEGGDVDRNRWSTFNEVAGHHIHCARRGEEDLQTARHLTHGWMLSNMSPPWPEVRFESEWKALLNLDIRHHGAMPLPLAPAPLVSSPDIIDMVPGSLGSHGLLRLSDWSVDTWTDGARPERKFLVKGMILAGKPHLLAAEGGAGKTFLLLDLGLKIATHEPGKASLWCGAQLADDAGGTIVMFTTEDDREELHIRISDIDRARDRFKTNGKLIIIPTINVGGAFPLVERTPGTGTSVRSKAWNAHLSQLEQIKDLRLVVIDTLNTTLHGEENNATVINEYIQAAAAPICGKFGAALVVTHHTRKPGANTKIYSAEDMKSSIRGSTALIGAFRAVLGVWHAPDFKDRMEKLGREPEAGSLYNFAVVKANNPQMDFETKALLRDRSGLLIDVTDQERRAHADEAAHQEAWLIKAVEVAALAGHPFTVSGNAGLISKPPNGRKHQLPRALQSMSEDKLKALCGRLVSPDGGNALVKVNPKGKSTYQYLDVPNGALVRGVGPDGMEYQVAGNGADFEPPHWEVAFAYEPSMRRMVPRASLGDHSVKTGGGRSDGPLAPVQTPGCASVGTEKGSFTSAHPAPETIPYNPGVSDG
jgi:hypothetical protein